MQLIELTYVILAINVLALWLPLHIKSVKLWQIILPLTLILAYLSHVITLIGIGIILVFYALVYFYQKNPGSLRYLLWVLIAFLGLALELHLVPGFHNWLIMHQVKFTADAIPFTLYLNLDKTLVGLIILGLCLNLNSNYIEWNFTFVQTFKYVPLVIIILLGLSLMFGYVRFEPKLPTGLWVWVLDNLLFTCVAEEGLFRGFLQTTLSQAKYQLATPIAIFIPALIFGLIHYHGGVIYVILATVAGILYGWVYQVTKRIEASILTHFLLNLIHLLLFTYPALNTLKG